MSSPRTLKVVAPEAGWSPDPLNDANRQRQLEAEDRLRWKQRFERIIRLEIAMFDTDEESDMDLMQAADATCRKYDSIMMKKQQRGEELKLAMAALEREGLDQLEFNDVEWMRLDSQLKALRRSWLKFSTAFEVALTVRHAVAGHTGSRWGQYRRAADFKAQRALDNKQRMSTIAASSAVGLSPQQFAAWQQWRLQYDPQVDGVDGDPDAPGPTAADQKALADRQHQQALASKGATAKYLRRQPTVVPKAGVDIAPSGKRGSRHKALTEAVHKDAQH